MLSGEACCGLPSLSTWPRTMLIGLYHVGSDALCIHCDGIYAMGSWLLNYDCTTLLHARLLDEIVTWPAYAWVQLLP